MRKLELLAPAGDPEKLKTVIDYGADAVYFGGRAFSLRAGAGNLTTEEMRRGTDYAHERGANAYLALNIYARNEDLAPMETYLKEIRNVDVDAFLISDPGVLELVRDILPDAAIHVSTQANVTNARAAAFWHRLGARRIVLARELSLREIREIRDALPDDVELEAFVHGAMCVSYSGRCFLSSYMTGRSANRGACAHPCRYRYALMEEKRPGQFFPVEEDARGTYIMNADDLCMIGHIPELAEAGVRSLKIEGRMKSVFYAATVVRAYRMAIDAYENDPETWRPEPVWLEELGTVSHRRFSTGFYFGTPGAEALQTDSSEYIRPYAFVGKVLSSENGQLLIEQRNRLSVGDAVEIFGPGPDVMKMVIREMRDADTGLRIRTAPHAQQRILIPAEHGMPHGSLVRRKEGEAAPGEAPERICRIDDRRDPS